MLKLLVPTATFSSLTGTGGRLADGPFSLITFSFSFASDLLVRSAGPAPNPVLTEPTACSPATSILSISFSTSATVGVLPLAIVPVTPLRPSLALAAANAAAFCAAAAAAAAACCGVTESTTGWDFASFAAASASRVFLPINRSYVVVWILDVVLNRDSSSSRPSPDDAELRLLVAVKPCTFCVRSASIIRSRRVLSYENPLHHPPLSPPDAALATEARAFTSPTRPIRLLFSNAASITFFHPSPVGCLRPVFLNSKRTSVSVAFLTACFLARSITWLRLCGWPLVSHSSLHVKSSCSYVAWRSGSGDGYTISYEPLWSFSHFSRSRSKCSRRCCRLSSRVLPSSLDALAVLLPVHLPAKRREIASALAFSSIFANALASMPTKSIVSLIRSSLTARSSGVSAVNEGEWFTSMSQGLRSLSIITSMPRISKHAYPSFCSAGKACL
mmetsp:Transcript_8445/g.38437  ORF Transcript_8445/g.38437 Transcript_8445/m.38437 type:complete len:445 (+) Transcript_8445:214-1548(+)